MKVELSHTDLISLVRGTGGPGNYTSKFNHIGELTGFPNERWVWKESILKNMSEEALWELYQRLKAEK